MQKYIRLSAIALTAGLLSCSVQKEGSQSAEEQLSQQLVSSVLWFQQSAEMTASYLQAYQYGKLILAGKLDTVQSTLPPAVVLDIDETVLDNSPYEVYLIEKGELYQPSTWKEWTDKARAEALPGALDFVNYAKEKGVEVFYISNRKTDELDATIQNLKAHLFPFADADHVFLKETTSDKTARRAKVAAEYNILLFVGDNLTDYSELYADRGIDLGKQLIFDNKEDLLYNFIMLPNPMYGEWEKAIYGNDFSISGEEKLKKRTKVLER